MAEQQWTKKRPSAFTIIRDKTCFEISVSDCKLQGDH